MVSKVKIFRVSCLVMAIVVTNCFLFFAPVSAEAFSEKRLYVTNEDDDTISMVEDYTHKEKEVIPIGNQPRGVAAYSPNNRIYISQPYEHNVLVIDTTTNSVVDTISVTGLPRQLIVNSDGTRLYAADFSSNGAVSVIDTTTNTVLTTLTGFSTPEGLAINQDNTRLYVANADAINPTVSVLDITNAYSLVSTVAVLDKPTSIVITPDGTKAYVANYDNTTGPHYVSVIDTATSSIATNIRTGLTPYKIAMNNAGTKAYVLGVQDSISTGSSILVTIDVTTDKVTKEYGVGSASSGLAISPDDKTVYLTLNGPGENRIEFYGTPNETLDGYITVGSRPAEIVTGVFPAPTGVVTFGAWGDSYIGNGMANRNLGASTFMRVRSNGDNRAMLRFDLPAMQAAIGGKRVFSAKLHITITENSNNWGSVGREVGAYRLLNDWTEGNGDENNRGTGAGATWNCITDSDISDNGKDCDNPGVTEWKMGPTNEPGELPWEQTATDSQTIVNGQSGVIEYDVTPDVIAFMEGSLNDYGWLIKKVNEAQSGSVSLGTKEGGAPAQLIIIYRP